MHVSQAHEVKNQRVIAIKEDFPNYEIWTRCNNPKTDYLALCMTPASVN